MNEQRFQVKSVLLRLVLTLASIVLICLSTEIGPLSMNLEVIYEQF